MLVDKLGKLRIYADYLTGCDQRVVEWLEFCVSDRFEINKAKRDQFFLVRGIDRY